MASVCACGSGSENAQAVVVSSDRCVVRLHGKGSTGSTATIEDGVAILAPDGNGRGWEALQWDYNTEEEIAAGAGIVRMAIDSAGCDAFVIHGFSNGASMATALL